jgi:hypothetical protein
MSNETKTNEIKEQIRVHKAMIESLSIQLKEKKSNKPYSDVKKAWLQTMKVCTKPFAVYHKNINSYLDDPEIYALEKDIIKIQDACLKITLNSSTFTSEKHITKAIQKLIKLEKKILANPSYISQRYEDCMNVKETLDEVLNVRTFLFELKNMLTAQILTQPGITKTPNDILETVSSP